MSRELRVIQKKGGNAFTNFTFFPKRTQGAGPTPKRGFWVGHIRGGLIRFGGLFYQVRSPRKHVMEGTSEGVKVKHSES